MTEFEGIIRYYITDRAQLPAGVTLLDNIARRLAAGIEMIQLRERDLSARQLHALAQQVLRLPNARHTRILINDRSDIALATGAAGVHLRANSVSPSRIRSIAPPDFVIGVSCHSVADVCRAEDEGASFAVLGPIYASPGKGPPLGLGPLADAAHRARIPVLALGGISSERIPECINSGAAGIAGISMFQRA